MLKTIHSSLIPSFPEVSLQLLRKIFVEVKHQKSVTNSHWTFRSYRIVLAETFSEQYCQRCCRKCIGTSYCEIGLAMLLITKICTEPEGNQLRELSLVYRRQRSGRQRSLYGVESDMKAVTFLIRTYVSTDGRQQSSLPSSPSGPLLWQLQCKKG